MKYFYKTNPFARGTGKKIPKGFREYTPENPPKEFTDALTIRESNETKQSHITELKQLLRDTDYVGLSDYDGSKPDVIAQRLAWRKEIRELEND